jgi:hypothetical protein
MDDRILPECFIDTILVETLVFPQKAYNHQKGCNTVCKVMQEDRLLKDDFALGILDDDKRKPDYLKVFDFIVELHQLKLFKHPKKHHYLILHPPIENWIIGQVNEINQTNEKKLILTDYDLPTDLKGLKTITKIANSKNNPCFKRLFRDLKNKNASGITQLANWIEYLKTNPYNADKETLQRL